METPESFNYFVINAETDQGPKELQCTPDNTELYLHSEDWSEVDHIFHRIDERDRRLGGFVWRHATGNFDDTAQAMVQSGNWLVTYRPVPLESDMAQYAQDVVEVPDELPEDFS